MAFFASRKHGLKYFSSIFITNYKNCTHSYCESVNEDIRKRNLISNTNVILQDGTSIMEMPFIAQVINGDFKIGEICGKSYIDKIKGLRIELPVLPSTMTKILTNEAEVEMCNGFLRCNSIKELFSLLGTCPQEEITPTVALTIIQQVFELENNIYFRNVLVNQYPPNSAMILERRAMMKCLMDIVCTSSQPHIVINALGAICRDMWGDEKWKYAKDLCAEVVLLTVKNKLDVNDICDAIRFFYSLGTLGKQYLEKMWIGIDEKVSIINAKEFCNIVNVLPMIKDSRRYLYNIVERKMPYIYTKLKSEQIICIFQVLVELKLNNSRLLPYLARWTNLNIHNLLQGDLRWIIYSLLSLKFTSPEIEKAIYRYLKVGLTKIWDIFLICIILDYFSKLRIRNESILDLTSEYFVSKETKFSPSQTASAINCFGKLNYIPSNKNDFFRIVNDHISKNFFQYDTEGILDILLSCAYLDCFPHKFRYIHHPIFIDKINSLRKGEFKRCHSKLKILTAALFISCPDYEGPIFEKQNSNFVKRDARILKCLNKIKEPLKKVIGNNGAVLQSVLLPTLPLDSFYVIDFVFSVTQSKIVLKDSFKQLFGLLIHVPEHYDISGTIINGEQSMKIRHLQHFGLKVVSVSFKELEKIVNKTDDLLAYLNDHIENVKSKSDCSF